MKIDLAHLQVVQVAKRHHHFRQLVFDLFFAFAYRTIESSGFCAFFLSFTLFLMLLFGCNIDRKLILMKDMLTGSALDAILNVRVFSIKDGVRAKSNHSNTFAQVKCYGTTWKQKFIFILSKW